MPRYIVDHADNGQPLVLDTSTVPCGFIGFVKEHDARLVADGLNALDEIERLRPVVAAARQLDALFGGSPSLWTLGGEPVSDEATDVLLSLHDHLNDVDHDESRGRTSLEAENEQLGALGDRLADRLDAMVNETGRRASASYGPEVVAINAWRESREDGGRNG